MAKQTIVQLTDDIDGGEAAESVTFSLRGVEYEIDLSAKNAAALEKALDKYIQAGRRVGRGRGPRGVARRSGTTRRADVGNIRSWATENGFTVSTRGRIPAEVRQAYEAAQG